jgi:predicted nucleic acid-binding protein
VKAFGYLVDTSAFVRLMRDNDLRSEWNDEVDAGSLAICPLTELEIFYAARSAAHRRELKSTLKDAYRWVAMPDRIYRRAESVQQTLTERGTHRSAGAVDLLVAATAEEHGLTLLHYDTDFMQVAQVTGQPIRWLAEPGSIS